jgi:MazG family protein
MQQLLTLMHRLRQECPWNQAQTLNSLSQYAIEEAYEVDAAIRGDDPLQLKEELGDLLLQVVFQAELLSEQGQFDFQDVVDGLKQKLIRRHPHVFAAAAQPVPDSAAALWRQMKQQEQQAKGQQMSRLDEIKAGPSICQAQQLQVLAAQFNFDWPDLEGAWLKLDEELLELKQAIDAQDQAHILEELGDSLFALVNVGRKLQQDSDQAMWATIRKFRRRFAYIEQQLAQQGLRLEQCSLQQLDALWDAAKDELKN